MIFGDGWNGGTYNLHQQQESSATVLLTGSQGLIHLFLTMEPCVPKMFINTFLPQSFIEIVRNSCSLNHDRNFYQFCGLPDVTATLEQTGICEDKTPTCFSYVTTCDPNPPANPPGGQIFPGTRMTTRIPLFSKGNVQIGLLA